MMAIGGTVERAADAVLNRSPLQPFFRWIATERLTVLAYHEIADPRGFERQVRYLRTAMRPVSLRDVIAAADGSHSLPPYAALITFDDGDRSVYDEAVPILQAHGVPAVAFVVAGLLDTDEPFWWREVEHLVGHGASAPGLPQGEPDRCVRILKQVPDSERHRLIGQLRRSTPHVRLRMPQLGMSDLVEMEGAGVAIGNHTTSHPCLDRCSDAQVASEVADAHARLTEALGHPPGAFAYPNGNFDDRTVPVLTELGYGAAFLFDHRLGESPPPDRYRISRLRVSSRTSDDRFRIIVSGLHSTVHHLVGRQ
jgi:peptidoglycan/xylan/chitin deacetylase (PgdA/CDA1 family)